MTKTKKAAAVPIEPLLFTTDQAHAALGGVGRTKPESVRRHVSGLPRIGKES